MTPMEHLRAGALGLGLVLAFVSSPSQAFQPSNSEAGYEIPLRQFNLHGFTNPMIASAKQAAMRALEVKYGGAWDVYSWNPQTNTPSLFDGSGAQVASPFTSAEEAAAAARGLLAQNPQVFGARVADLRFESAPKGRGKQSVIYQQVHQGIDVIGGRVHAVFTEGGRFFTGGSDFYSGITVSAMASVPRSVAERIAQDQLAIFNPATDSIEPGTGLFILPVPISETQVEHHLVWKIRVRTADPVGIWVTHVDAHSGQILWRWNDVHFVNFLGYSIGRVQPVTYCDGTVSQGFPYLRIQVSGVGTTTTDANADWTLAYGGIDPHTVFADLFGPYVDVNNVAGPNGTYVGTGTPGVPLSVRFLDTNSQADERNVFKSVNDVHEFISRFDPAFPYTNARITANVGVAGTCNAYYNGSSINFYAAGGGCANTGEIQGIVHHEYGHGIQESILGGQGNEGLGEGNGDVLANLMTQESIIGRGLFVGDCVNGLRDSNNSFQYPDDVVGEEIHFAGQTIAGFHWDQLELFQAQFGAQAGTDLTGALWHFGRVLEHPMNQPAQVHATFVADDDDGDLTDGTPNHDLICQAATNHGFDCPPITTGLLIFHTPIVTSLVEGDRNVDAMITTTDGTLVLANMYVDYRQRGGSFLRAPLAPISDSLYRAVIPNLEAPSEVEYYLHAENSLGESKNHPTQAPSVLHAFDVPNYLETQEAANGWIINPDGTDTATTGQWTRVDPNGTEAQPEDDHTPDPGAFCFVTGQGSIGGPIGEQDIDGGTVTLQSVEYDLTGATSARAKLFYWYSNDQGPAPGTDTWTVQVRNNGGPWQNALSTMTSTNSWSLLDVDLLARFGGSLGIVTFRFVASDLDAVSVVEAGIDDLEILVDLDGSSAVGDPLGETLRFALGSATPTPFAGQTNIHFQVPVATAVRITVYDVSGRAVKTVANGSFAAGVHDVAWDGRDELSHPVASGVYFYRMMSQGFVANRSTVLQR